MGKQFVLNTLINVFVSQGKSEHDYKRNHLILAVSPAICEMLEEYWSKLKVQMNTLVITSQTESE